MYALAQRSLSVGTSIILNSEEGSRAFFGGCKSNSRGGRKRIPRNAYDQILFAYLVWKDPTMHRHSPGVSPAFSCVYTRGLTKTTAGPLPRDHVVIFSARGQYTEIYVYGGKARVKTRKRDRFEDPVRCRI